MRKEQRSPKDIHRFLYTLGIWLGLDYSSFDGVSEGDIRNIVLLFHQLFNANYEVEMRYKVQSTRERTFLLTEESQAKS